MSNNPIVIPPIPTGEMEISIREADLSSPKELLTPDGIAGILVPQDTKPRDNYVILQYINKRITSKSIAVASASVGDDTRASIDKEIVEVYNVAPQKGLLEVLIRINPKARYRVQIIVYY